MNPNMKWLLNGRVLYWKLSGNVSIEQFRSGLTEINRILQETNQKIHVVVNASQAQCLNGNTGQIHQISRTVANHGSMGCFFVIAHNFLFRCQLNRFTVDFGTHLRYSSSFGNAWRSLQTIDSSLPYSTPEKPSFMTARKFA